MTIHTFPLAWRWTDSRYAILPPDSLARIEPLDAAVAALVHDRWIACFDRYGEVIPTRFQNIERYSTEGTWTGDTCRRQPSRIDEVRQWLRRQEPRLELPICISWTRELAVRTNWDIFAEWWDDFCYPVADDLFIVPDTADWLLAFHHEDWFTFCRVV